MIRRFVLLTLAILLEVASTGYCLFGEVSSSNPFENDKLPKVVIKAINDQQRVYGYADQGEATLFFKGDTKKLNQFLAALAGTRDISLEAELIPWPGEGRTVWPFEQLSDAEIAAGKKSGKAFQYDWALELRIVYVLDERGKVTGERYLLLVGIHTRGNVKLSDLQLPLSFEASFASPDAEATFVEVHNERRESTQATSGPTTWATVFPGLGVFAGTTSGPVTTTSAASHP